VPFFEIFTRISPPKSNLVYPQVSDISSQAGKKFSTQTLSSAARYCAAKKTPLVEE
jgi:hypothetical protein